MRHCVKLISPILKLSNKQNKMFIDSVIGLGHFLINNTPNKYLITYIYKYEI